MSWRFLPQLTLSVGMLALVEQSAGSQQLDALSTGFPRPAPAAAAAAPGPSTISMGGRSIGWAFMGAAAAGGVGFAIDRAYCEEHHGDETGFLFGPCFLYTGTGTTVGWFGGALIGATVGASRVARQRGCPSRTARMRAFAGAILGVAPGLSIVARRPGKYPPAHTVLIMSAPLLAGAGATAAVASCRAS